MRWGNDRSGASNASALSLLLFLLATQCTAQLSDLPNLKSSSTKLGSSSSSSVSSSATPTTSSQKTKSAATSSNSKASTSSATSTASTTGGTSVSLTGGISITSSTSSESGPTSIFHLTDLPTVAGATIPTQVVPDTANAPFMQKSSLPEGSVFIIVGAILGFFGACVLLWRGAVAWSLSRSVKRAAIAQHQTFDLKSSAYAKPSAGVYSQGPIGSTASMEALTALAPTKTKHRSHKPSSSIGGGTSTYTPSGMLNSRSSTQNLFFSPTAGAGHPSQAPSPHVGAGTRGSQNYLPAGYYASGSSQPAGGQNTTHINAHAAAPGAGQRGSSLLNPLSDRLSGLRAESAGYQRTSSFGPSPPGSPYLAPTLPSGAASRTMSPGNASSVVGQVSGPTGGSSGAGLYSQPSYSTLNASSLNLSVPGGSNQPGGRTPSAYLEDLFENHGNGPRERF